MWDLEQIIRQNNEAALDYMMQGQKVNQAQSPLPAVWPLTLLADKLKADPPMLSEVIDCLLDFKSAEQFLMLVHTLMPEHELEIMTEPRNRRVYRFGYLFAKKYYPLPLNTECGMENLAAAMPVEILGMSYSSYHELVMRPGYLLLLSLVVYPFEGDERDLEDDDVPFNPAYLPDTKKFKPSASDKAWVKNLVSQLAVGGKWTAPMGFSMTKTAENTIELRQAENTPEVKETIARTLMIAERLGIQAKCAGGMTSEEKMAGARIPLIDKVQQLVGADLAGLIPEEGWEPGDLHKMTDSTRYQGVGEFADWACKCTGFVMLDTSFEDCEYIEGNGEPIFMWTKRNVDILTEEWPMVQGIRNKIDHIVDWLEDDPANHFKELLEFLLAHQPEKKERGHSVYDGTEHGCILDQRGDDNEEETDDDGEQNSGTGDAVGSPGAAGHPTGPAAAAA